MLLIVSNETKTTYTLNEKLCHMLSTAIFYPAQIHVLTMQCTIKQKLTSSSVTCTVANVISWCQHDASICAGSSVFKTFTGNVPFSASVEYTKKDLFEAFSPKLSSEKRFLCNNSDQTCFSDTLTSAGPLGRCWSPRLSARVSTPPSRPSRC